MSRAVFLNMRENAVIAHCEAEQIGISSIKSSRAGGTRLVCMSVDGAAKVRQQLKAKLIKDEDTREQGGPGRDFVARS